MGVNPDFWAGRRIFLTGHTGFKGAWLSLWLQRLGAHVTGFSLAPPTIPSLYQIAEVGDGMTSIMGDVRNLLALEGAIEKARAEIVIHLAAQSLVRRSYVDPIETLTTNVIGTANVLEAARNFPTTKALIIVTSDKCYENSETGRNYVESDPLGGYDLYSASKACAEIVTSAYRSSFFEPRVSSELAIASVRAGNVIGGGDWAHDRLIPDVMRSFASGKKALLRNPNAVRPWQHVLEPLSGYLVLSEKLIEEGSAFAEAWNFGPNPKNVTHVGEVADLIAKAWNASPGWSLDSAPHPHEATILSLDSSKSKKRLLWNPKLDLATTLNWTIDWYRRNAAGTDARILTLEQVDRYMESA